MGKEDVILGLPWLRNANPTINWTHKTIAIQRIEVPLIDTFESLSEFVKDNIEEEIEEPLPKPVQPLPKYCEPFKQVFEKTAAE